jgi:hypothetical protein
MVRRDRARAFFRVRDRRSHKDSSISVGLSAMRAAIDLDPLVLEARRLCPLSYGRVREFTLPNPPCSRSRGRSRSP